MMEMEGYLTTKEAGDRLGLSDGRIRQMIISGVIEGAIKFGGVHVIPEAEINRLKALDRKAGRPVTKANEKH